MDTRLHMDAAGKTTGRTDISGRAFSADYSDAGSGAHLVSNVTKTRQEAAMDENNMTQKYWRWVRKWFGFRSQFPRELCAEFIGTLFFVLIGQAAYAVQVLSRDQAGNVVSSNLAWGFGIFLATLMTFKISGACLNPAVTLAYAVVGRLPWIKVIPYCIAQIAGAYCGAGLVYFLYHDAINKFDGGWRQIEGFNATAHIFATYPKEHVREVLGMDSAIFDQVLAAFALVMGYLAATDPFNGFPEYLVPFAIAFNLAANGFAFMYNAGGAVNPARDLGPRIMTLCCYGTGVFSYRNHNWFWIPVVGPLIGGLLAAFIYKFVLGIHHPEWDNRPKEHYTRTHHTRAVVVADTGKGTEQGQIGRAPTEELVNLIDGAERALHKH